MKAKLTLLWRVTKGQRWATSLKITLCLLLSVCQSVSDTHIHFPFTAFHLYVSHLFFVSSEMNHSVGIFVKVWIMFPTEFLQSRKTYCTMSFFRVLCFTFHHIIVNAFMIQSHSIMLLILIKSYVFGKFVHAPWRNPTFLPNRIKSCPPHATYIWIHFYTHLTHILS